MTDKMPERSTPSSWFSLLNGLTGSLREAPYLEEGARKSACAVAKEALQTTLSSLCQTGQHGVQAQVPEPPRVIPAGHRTARGIPSRCQAAVNVARANEAARYAEQNKLTAQVEATVKEIEPKRRKPGLNDLLTMSAEEIAKLDMSRLAVTV